MAHRALQKQGASLCCEVPLQHGKLLTDGSGGVVEVSREVPAAKTLGFGLLAFWCRVGVFRVSTIAFAANEVSMC